MFLQLARKFPGFILFFVVLDILLTGVIYFGSIFLLSRAWLSGPPYEQLLALVSAAISRPPTEYDPTDTIFKASLATAYLTSIWLWLALIFTPIVRVVVWSRTTGLTAIGRMLDAERKPMVALGYVTALLILACGGIVWGIGRAMAAFT